MAGSVAMVGRVAGHPVTAAVALSQTPGPMRRCCLELPGPTCGHSGLGSPCLFSPVCLPLPFTPMGQVCCPGWHVASLLLFGVLSPALQLKLPKPDATGMVLAPKPSWGGRGMETRFCLKQAGSNVCSGSTAKFTIP